MDLKQKESGERGGWGSEEGDGRGNRMSDEKVEIEAGGERRGWLWDKRRMRWKGIR